MGALFKKPKVPDIKVNAPAIENPVLEEHKKNKGKKALRIDYVGSARGTNPL